MAAILSTTRGSRCLIRYMWPTCAVTLALHPRHNYPLHVKAHVCRLWVILACQPHYMMHHRYFLRYTAIKYSLLLENSRAIEMSALFSAKLFTTEYIAKSDHVAFARIARMYVILRKARERTIHINSPITLCLRGSLYFILSVFSKETIFPSEIFSTRSKV